MGIRWTVSFTARVRSGGAVVGREARGQRGGAEIRARAESGER